MVRWMRVSEADGLDVKLEDDSRETRLGFEYMSIVCDAKLVDM